MTAKYFFHQAWKRLTIHWLMILKGLVYGVLLWMFASKRITTQEWILAVGSVLTLNSLMSKDTSKLETKDKFKRPDPIEEPEEINT